MAASAPNEITRLLQRWSGGDRDALDALTPRVYDELRSVASRRLAAERRGHTLQTTDLVHEAFANLIDVEVDWRDRSHFFAVAATAMRRILVDHARSLKRIKRGGGRFRLTLGEAHVMTPTPSADLVALDDALERLAEFDARKSRVVELHYFGGLTCDEAAAVLDVAPITIKRDLKLARAWLYSELSGEPPDAT